MGDNTQHSATDVTPADKNNNKDSETTESARKTPFDVPPRPTAVDIPTEKTTAATVGTSPIVTCWDCLYYAHACVVFLSSASATMMILLSNMLGALLELTYEIKVDRRVWPAQDKGEISGYKHGDVWWDHANILASLLGWGAVAVSAASFSTFVGIYMFMPLYYRPGATIFGLSVRNLCCQASLRANFQKDASVAANSAAATAKVESAAGKPAARDTAVPPPEIVKHDAFDNVMTTAYNMTFHDGTDSTEGTDLSP